MSAAQWLAIVLIGLPALIVVLWPLVRGGAAALSLRRRPTAGSSWRRRPRCTARSRSWPSITSVVRGTGARDAIAIDHDRGVGERRAAGAVDQRGTGDRDRKAALGGRSWTPDNSLMASRIELGGGAWLDYLPAWIASLEADRLLLALRDELAWEQRRS